MTKKKQPPDVSQEFADADALIQELFETDLQDDVQRYKAVRDQLSSFVDFMWPKKPPRHLQRSDEMAVSAAGKDVIAWSSRMEPVMQLRSPPEVYEHYRELCEDVLRTISAIPTSNRTQTHQAVVERMRRLLGIPPDDPSLE